MREDLSPPTSKQPDLMVILEKSRQIRSRLVDVSGNYRSKVNSLRIFDKDTESMPVDIMPEAVDFVSSMNIELNAIHGFVKDLEISYDHLCRIA